jgi:hypothetical protein
MIAGLRPTKRGLQGLTPRLWQDGFCCLRNAVRAALLLPLFLVGCSGLAQPTEAMPASGPDPAYRDTVVAQLKTLKDYESYEAFEMSDFRWVHSSKGWSWLTCVRFQDRGRARTYALFIKGRDLINSRFAVEADGCGTQNYAPFDLLGAKKPNGLDPLH